MMKKIKLIAYLFIAICTLNSCTDEVEPQDTNYVTFESDSYSFGVDIDGESTNTITMYASNKSSMWMFGLFCLPPKTVIFLFFKA